MHKHVSLIILNDHLSYDAKMERFPDILD